MPIDSRVQRRIAVLVGVALFSGRIKEGTRGDKGLSSTPEKGRMRGHMSIM